MVSALVWNNSKAFKEYVDRVCTLRKYHTSDVEVTIGYLNSLPTLHAFHAVSETGGWVVTPRVDWSALIRGYQVYQVSPHGFSRN